MKNFLVNCRLIWGLALLGCISGVYAQGSDEWVVTPENALVSYLELEDDTYTWELKETIKAGPVTGYNLLLTSQTWKGHVWKHQLTIIVPNEVKYDGSLLFITGGSVNDGEPRWRDVRKDGIVLGNAQIAMDNKAIVSVLRNVPMQPLYDGLTEDALISRTLHNFKNDGDYTWPLLFPMVKSAIKAMDAVQAFTKAQLDVEVNDFVIAGASKRGWTSWLTGASGDTRVKAIAPMVIDIVNMPVNLSYQLEVYDEYSEEIQDYTDLEIPQQANTEEGKMITTMIDPYSYRKLLDMPKMIFNGTNDPYWVVDAIKHYLDSIPGKNYLHYVPNAGHNLGDGKQAFQALNSFFGFTIQDEEYPICDWQTEVHDGEVRLHIDALADRLVGVKLWEAHSSDRDFRDEEWSSADLGISGVADVKAAVRLPNDGYKAFYIDLIYNDLNGNQYSQSTRVFVTNNQDVL